MFACIIFSFDLVCFFASKSEDNQPTGEQDYCHGVDELLDEDTSSTAARSDTSIFGILDFAIDFYFYA
jgi:hypothetical protein